MQLSSAPLVNPTDRLTHDVDAGPVEALMSTHGIHIAVLSGTFILSSQLGKLFLACIEQNYVSDASHNVTSNVRVRAAVQPDGPSSTCRIISQQRGLNQPHENSQPQQRAAQN